MAGEHEPTPPTRPVGLNLYLDDHSDYGRLEGVLDAVAASGVNTLAVAYLIGTAGPRASTVFQDPRAPSDAQLRAVIRAARDRRLRVMLRPLLDEAQLVGAGVWRGTIRPQDVGAWFRSYGGLIHQYAQLAAQESVEFFDIGSELTSMEGFLSEWRALVADVRQTTPSLLTYSSTYFALSPAIWALLDFGGIDGYWPLAAPVPASVEDLVAAWQGPVAEIRRAANKPILITELGILPSAGAHLHPATWYLTGRRDLEAQRRYYQAACEALRPVAEAILFWNVDLNPAGNDFSPLATAVEPVLRESCR